jgi:hypothetical protein
LPTASEADNVENGGSSEIFFRALDLLAVVLKETLVPLRALFEASIVKVWRQNLGFS